jgi:hypothetical protein
VTRTTGATETTTVADTDQINQQQQTKNMTTTQIQITPAPSELLRYAHSSLDDSTAQSLAQQITDLEQSGFTVVDAVGARSSVPASYRSAYKMSAPHWYYYGGTIRAINAKLENRPKGASIPAVFEIRGSVVPEGYRCFKRNEETIIIRRK